MNISLTNKILTAVLVVVIVIFGGAAYYVKSYSTKIQKTGTISGSFNINGYVGSNSTVSVLAKLSTEQNYYTIVSNIQAVDGEGWSWSNAEEGKTYDVQAVLVVNGQKAGLSQIRTMEAPATGEVLNITSVANPPAPQSASISGTIDLNGAVTPQSTISLFARKVGDPSYALVSSTVAAQDGAYWSWNGGVAGAQYQLKATLYVNGQYSGEAPSIIVTAPAANEILRINSQFSPPPTQVAITGSFNINGPVPANSTITLYKQGPGDSGPVAIQSNLEAANGVTWNWNSAIAGYAYTMTATVFSNGQSMGSSQTLSVTAPAANEVLNININVPGNPTSQPSSSPSISCISQNGNVWNATLNMAPVNGAATYWLQVGSQSGQNDVLDTKVSANGSSTTSYSLTTLNNGQTYYAQYAASTCNNCQSSGSYSGFSNILQFVCQPTQPTPTPTPYPAQPTYTPYPTAPPPTAAPTAVPTTVPTAVPTTPPTATPVPPTSVPPTNAAPSPTVTK